MLKIEKTTRLGPGAVIDRAVTFFGTGGLGLDLVEKDACCARFDGGGGFVLVQTTGLPEERKTSVVVEGREWEIQIKEFMGKL
jgi:hypothetical protein